MKITNAKTHEFEQHSAATRGRWGVSTPGGDGACRHTLGQGEEEESRGGENDDSRGGENEEGGGSENEKSRGDENKESREDVAEKTGHVMGCGTGRSVFVQVGTNNAEKEGMLAIVDVIPEIPGGGWWGPPAPTPPLLRGGRSAALGGALICGPRWITMTAFKTMQNPVQQHQRQLTDKHHWLDKMRASFLLLLCVVLLATAAFTSEAKKGDSLPVSADKQRKKFAGVRVKKGDLSGSSKVGVPGGSGADYTAGVR
ncbi:hypothetical protein LSAT2_030870 [Lamellibrachia satsuma]|nr:hypothetical protein LSAT2_030870 [Lamellibrachia satsuma]